MSSKAEAPANSERTTMTHITIERAKLEQILEALNSPAYGKELRELQNKAIIVAKQALEQPVQEPYGYVSTHTNGLMHFNKTFQGVYTDTATEIVAVHTNPPAAPVPLTDEKIDTAWLLNGGGLAANRYYDFARAIEAAHGITKGQR
jgi:hypothetical protein